MMQISKIMKKKILFLFFVFFILAKRLLASIKKENILSNLSFLKYLIQVNSIDILELELLQLIIFLL